MKRRTFMVRVRGFGPEHEAFNATVQASGLSLENVAYDYFRLLRHPCVHTASVIQFDKETLLDYNEYMRQIHLLTSHMERK